MTIGPAISLTCLVVLFTISCCHDNPGESANGGGCVHIDAALNDVNNILYLFQGDEYVKLDNDGNEVRKGPIHEFGGLQADIDAAVVWAGKKTYFFKGDKYYKLSWLIVGPYRMSAWGNEFENGIDAAGNWEGHTHFFKGCNVYRFQAGKKQVEETFNGEEVGFPCDVDAAFSMGDSFYVIKGDRAWEWGGDVDESKPLAEVVTLTSWNVCPGH